jgi:phytoene dehydrogenase-like protein
VPFLTFRLGAMDCSMRIVPSVVDPQQPRRVRLIRSLRHGTPAAQADTAVEELLEASWWKEGLDDIVVRGTRTPRAFGEAANLYNHSMNPVMTQAFMRQGRIPQRVPDIEGLVLTGSATHPGQWVSFCAISGLLSAATVG